MKRTAKLILEDGSVIKGKSFGYEGVSSGEVVFNTAMTGYPESLTDPSYKGQLLVLTYPIVGNYGVPENKLLDDLSTEFESESVQVSGLIISDYSFEFNHWNASKSLGDWLKEYRIPGIYDIDTRALTKKLRDNGTMLGKIVFENNCETDFYDPNKENLVAQVSIDRRTVYGHGKNRILLVDCGVKTNIIRYLLEHDTTVVRAPWDYDFISEDYDGLFLTNGPGDPTKCEATINNLAKAMDRDVPIFGICLGSQLMALAAGARTYKLKYGHRSHNQPVIQLGSNRAYITSQNHGFAVDDASLGPDWEPYFINLNDNSNEGIRHKSKPFFSVQFHPEASGGPIDTEFLFEQFIRNVTEWKNQ